MGFFDSLAGRQAADNDSGNAAPLLSVDAENQRLKRQLRTAPARAAKQVMKAKQESDPPLLVEKTYAEQLQHDFFTPHWARLSHQIPTADPTCDEGEGKQRFVRGRARCVWSFLKCLKDKVVALFQNRGKVQHLLNICIADDTSTRLRPSTAERSIIYTIMNTVQFAHLTFADRSWEGIHIPTPVRCLNSGKAESIHFAFGFWMLASAQGIGLIWRLLGCTGRLLDNMKWTTVLLMGDALKANDAAWKTERAKGIQNSDFKSLGIRLKCNNHQLSLVRRPAVLSVERFWSTVVRLGNLLESQGFRKGLASALVSLLHKPGSFVRGLAEGVNFCWTLNFFKSHMDGPSTS